MVVARGIVAALALTMLAQTAAAQTGTLQEVESLASGGRYTQARAALDRWQQRRPVTARDVSAADRAHALLLRGRLSLDPAAAEESYLALALSYPASPFTAEALLLLGQGLLVRNDAARATTYLERLIRDHPASPHRVTGMLWLARAQGEAGHWSGACDIARRALVAGGDAEVTTLLRVEEGQACSRAASREEPEPPAMTSNETRTTVPGPDTRTGRFAVQTAAMRSRTGAQSLATRLRRLGFDARVALVEGNELFHVRVGRFVNSADAEAMLRRIRTAGSDGIIVSDARTERTTSR